MRKIIQKKIVVNTLFDLYQKKDENNQIWRLVSSGLCIENIKDACSGNLSIIVNTVATLLIRNINSTYKKILFEHSPMKSTIVSFFLFFKM